MEHLAELGEDPSQGASRIQSLEVRRFLAKYSSGFRGSMAQVAPSYQTIPRHDLHLGPAPYKTACIGGGFKKGSM